MTDKNRQNTNPEVETQASVSKYSCCSPEGMADMMQKFCGGEKGNFDCSSMMQKCCETK